MEARVAAGVPAGDHADRHRSKHKGCHRRREPDPVHSLGGLHSRHLAHICWLLIFSLSNVQTDRSNPERECSCGQHEKRVPCASMAPVEEPQHDEAGQEIGQD